MHEPGNSTAIDDFSPDNRALRRFTTMTVEHLDLIEWTREDGRPAMVTLTDLDSGDTVTLAVVDSLENRDPYVLLAATADGAIAAHGPFAGHQAASRYAPRAASAEATIIATCPAALRPTGEPALSNSAWSPIPEDMATSAHTAPVQTPATVVALLDRAYAVCVVVGPFDNHGAADAWRPSLGVDPAVDRLIVGLHPAPPEPATDG